MKAEAFQRAVRVLRLLYWPLVLAFLGYAAWRASALLPPVLATARPSLLLAAAVLWSCLHLVTPLFSWRALRDMGSDLGYRQVLRIHVSRLPARYLPGGIWQTVSRMADLHRLGLGKAQLARLVALENLVPPAMAALLGGACVAVTGMSSTGLAAACAGALLLVVIPVAARHRKLGGDLRPSNGFAGLMLSSVLFWLIAASAFACYWKAYPAASTHAEPLRIAGAYLLAWAAGFAAVFAPQGVGVFEAVIALLLKGSLPLAGTALVAAGFRLVILSADLFAFSILAALSRLPTRRVQPH